MLDEEPVETTVYSLGALPPGIPERRSDERHMSLLRVGALLVTDDREVWLPRLEVESVDATGAGDAFAAALTVALAGGDDWERAGRFASAAAALKTTRLGAQAGLPARDEVLALMERAAR